MDLKELKKADAKMEPFFLTAKYFAKNRRLRCILHSMSGMLFPRRYT
jgi:hypothetical protein